MARIVSEVLKKEYRTYRTYTANMAMLSLLFLGLAFILNTGSLAILSLVFVFLTGAGYIHYYRMRSVAIKHDYLPELLDKPRTR